MFNRREVWQGLAAGGVLMVGAQAWGQLGQAMRVLPWSTYQPSPCNGPCVCVWAGPEIPLGGRLYLAPTPSIPEVRAYSLRADLRTVSITWPEYQVHADGVLIEHFLGNPSTSQVRLEGATDGRTGVMFDSGEYVPDRPFPTALNFDASSQLFECTIYNLHVLAIPTCAADYDDGSALGLPDGGVSIDDLLYYLGLLDAGHPAADLDDGSMMGLPDRSVTIDDLIYFLDRFQRGC